MPLKLIGTKADGTKIPMTHDDVGLLADRLTYRSVFTIDDKSYDVDVDRAVVYQGGPKTRDQENMNALYKLGIVSFEIVEDEHAA